MKSITFERSCRLPASAKDAFAWHERRGAFERLVPPWSRVEVLDRQGSILDGDRTTLRLHFGPFWHRWVAEHRQYEAGRRFTDVQIEGPFSFWEHRHELVPLGPESATLTDRIELLPPFPVPPILLRPFVTRALDRIFAYRHRVTVADLATHQTHRTRAPLRVAITGASGLVGRTLAALLTTGGHGVVRLVRHEREPAPDEVRWSPTEGILDTERMEGVDALVHLAGENLAAGRWTARRRRRIYSSRVDATARLVRSLETMKNPPGIFVCASAVGYYGVDAGNAVDEEALSGEGFLAEVCRDWEEAARAATSICNRVAQLRFGIVLTPAGGALAKMLLPVRAGLGGVVGSGEQWVSWISVDDAVAAVLHVLMTPKLVGPVNLTAPERVTNRELMKTLGRLLWRPTIATVPARAVELLFGEMGRETLLASCGAIPVRLEATGYRFRHPTLQDALRHLLGTSR